MIKTSIEIKRYLRESIHIIRLSCLFKYRLHAEIIPANMGARQVQDYYNIRFFMYEGAIALRHNTVIAGSSSF